MFQPTDLSLSPMKSLAGTGVRPILTIKDTINGRDRFASVHSRPIFFTLKCHGVSSMTGLARTRPRIITSMAEMGGTPPRGVPAAKGASSSFMAETENRATKIKGTVVLMKKNVLDLNDLHASVLDRVHELLGKRVSLQLISADNCEPGEFVYATFSSLFTALCFFAMEMIGMPCWNQMYICLSYA
jgi:hypothetical protein